MKVYGICCVSVYIVVRLCVCAAAQVCPFSRRTVASIQTNGFHSPTDQITAITSEGEQWLLGHCHIGVPAQQKSGYFPAVPGLLMQRVCYGSAEILPSLAVRSPSIDLSLFETIPNYNQVIPSACISLDSGFDKWVRYKVTRTPTCSTSIARGLVCRNMHGRVLAVEQCNERHQGAHFSQRIQNVGSGKTCRSCEAVTHAAPSAAH